MALVAGAGCLAHRRRGPDPPANPGEGARLMGWLILLLLFALSLGALWLFGVRGGLLKPVAAALLLGGAGYAFQGRPDLPGAPATGNSGRSVVPLTEARH